MVHSITMQEIFGKTVILRQPKETDIEQRLALGLNAEIIRMFGGDADNHPPLHISKVSGWLESIKKHPHAWIVEHDKRLLGEVRLDNINELDRRARLAIGFYDAEKLGMGLGQEVTHLILQYAFKELQLHRVDLRVLAYNVRAIRCYEKCGFAVEGKERQSALVAGSWHDDMIMGILAHEYDALHQI